MFWPEIKTTRLIDIFNAVYSFSLEMDTVKS